MAALIAAFLFLLAFFGVDPWPGHSLWIAGLFFLALHWVWDYRPWVRQP